RSNTLTGAAQRFLISLVKVAYRDRSFVAPVNSLPAESTAGGPCFSCYFVLSPHDRLGTLRVVVPAFLPFHVPEFLDRGRQVGDGRLEQHPPLLGCRDGGVTVDAGFGPRRPEVHQLDRVVVVVLQA